MDDPEAVSVPEAVTHLWKCVKSALAANEDPQPRHIERMATTAGVELAASTIEGWFRTWSVVPVWEKFYALIKALEPVFKLSTFMADSQVPDPPSL